MRASRRGRLGRSARSTPARALQPRLELLLFGGPGTPTESTGYAYRSETAMCSPSAVRVCSTTSCMLRRLSAGACERASSAALDGVRNIVAFADVDHAWPGCRPWGPCGRRTSSGCRPRGCAHCAELGLDCHRPPARSGPRDPGGASRLDRALGGDHRQRAVTSRHRHRSREHCRGEAASVVNGSCRG